MVKLFYQIPGGAVLLFALQIRMGQRIKDFNNQSSEININNYYEYVFKSFVQKGELGNFPDELLKLKKITILVPRSTEVINLSDIEYRNIIRILTPENIISKYQPIIGTGLYSDSAFAILENTDMLPGSTFSDLYDTEEVREYINSNFSRTIGNNEEDSFLFINADDSSSYDSNTGKKQEKVSSFLVIAKFSRMSKK